MERLGRGADDVKFAMRRFFFYLASAGVVTVLIGLLMPARSYSGPGRMGITRSRAQALLIGIIIYKDEFGSYPIGINAVVTKSLRGENLKHKMFANFDGRSPQAINQSGQCVDGWGTPFQIDLSATNSPVIRSAGRDKIFGNKNDIGFDKNSFVKP